MWEILAGMPGDRDDYLQQLVQIIGQIRFVRVVRPANHYRDFHSAIDSYIKAGPH